jgi:hypothetical protein
VLRLLQAWRRAYKQYGKGVISAEALAEVTASCKAAASKGATSNGVAHADDPLGADDAEDIEPSALTHITVSLGLGLGPRIGQHLAGYLVHSSRAPALASIQHMLPT